MTAPTVLPEVEVLRRRLERATKRAERLEALVEDRARELFLTLERAKKSEAKLRDVLMAVPELVLVVDAEGMIQSANAAAQSLLGFYPSDLVGQSLGLVFLDDEVPTLEDLIVGDLAQSERRCRSRSGTIVPVLFSAAPLSDSMDSALDARHFVCVVIDIRQRKALEAELRHAQKLESVGRLAAGVAHEINTPIQFVGDSLHFLRGASDDSGKLIAALRTLSRDAWLERPVKDLARQARELEEELDFEYLISEVPRAFERAMEGLDRVASIVRSMKVFAHPDSTEATTVQLNQSIESVVTIARNEYKYIANVELDLHPLPPVRCFSGSVNQVLLNIVVNAAHAIADRVGDSGDMGTITIRSRHDDEAVTISISDTGGGIPASIRDKIFDPFFTTKEMGRGTGQGLALARGVVVEQHEGSLSFETELGKGTTFHVRLPIAGPARKD